MKPTLFIGVDVSQAEHVICAMTAEGQVQARERVPNDQQGTDQLIQRIAIQAREVTQLAVGLESTLVAWRRGRATPIAMVRA